MKEYMKLISKSIDKVSDRSKIDKTYNIKKITFLATYLKLLKYLDKNFKRNTSNLNNMINVKKLCQLSLKSSMLQLDNKLMESVSHDEKTLRKSHNKNIIDNLMFLIPLSAVTDEKHTLKLVDVLNFANVKDNTKYRSDVAIAVYEKYNKDKFPIEVKNKIKKIMHMYDMIKEEMIKYL